MQKWTSRIETPIKAELICYEVNGIHIVFGVTEENQLKLFHFHMHRLTRRIFAGSRMECG